MFSAKDELLRELFESIKEKYEEKELLGEIDTSYIDKYLLALELMLELENTLTEEQKEIFKKINALNFEYNLEREFIAFKLGYNAYLEAEKQKLN